MNLLQNYAVNEKMIIIIDELDRCKPSYAILMLEIVKHIFDIPNITFILSVNLKQLKASIEKSYGSNIDSQHYIDKFIKLTFDLPYQTNNIDINMNKSTINNSTGYFKILIEEYINTNEYCDRQVCYKVDPFSEKLFDSDSNSK